ncbi:hypothetical protein NLX83_36750 [Allokutzneria sp. A3M-2-11 16]|uniref:hypothetical protein n=1 Tax=Allokutzneria sp. A3M-2-11 16 TaxID=2962043 RepID=UPI0020B89962|nr:hypothetical protein [Allokutzneria sp. A3M-2-11 16]MCP3804831.1 hypothetical protein [Allokutzneria sp. A3M-2-11 16]
MSAAGFRFAWRGSHYSGRPVEELWFALDRDERGDWLFDAYFLGRLPLSGGAEHAAAFARWLLAPPPRRRYEKDFVLLDDEPTPGRAISWLAPDSTEAERVEDTELTVEIILGRDEDDGPEYLILQPSGHAPRHGFAFQICAELVWEPMDRAAVEHTAALLLDAADMFGNV